MLKNNELIFSNLQKVSDGVVVGLAWFLSYYVRFEVMTGAERGLVNYFLKLTPFLIISTLYFYRKFGLYNSQRFNSRYKEITAVVKANSFGFFAFVLGLYFFAPVRLSRITLFYYFIFSSVSLTILRISVRNFLRTLRKKGYNLRHVILIGSGPQIIDYIKGVKLFKDAGISISGWIDCGDIDPTQFNIKKLTVTIADYLKENTPDSLIIGYSSKNYQQVEGLLKQFHNSVYNIQVLPDLSYSLIGHELTEFAGVPMISMNQPKLNNFDVFTKRIFDFFVSFITIILISPLLIIISALVKLTSRGPVFFGQERMGLDGKSFMMWKFRSMKVDAESKTGAVWAVENDPRRTKFGTFLRETSLDELPQFFNVLFGEMSLVGPRPERPVFVEKFKDEIPAYMLRHKMKAGITGWAQVNGWRGNTSLEKRIECDIYYIKNWSIILDIKILFMTLYRGFVNKNAY